MRVCTDVEWSGLMFISGCRPVADSFEKDNKAYDSIYGGGFFD